MELHRCDSNGPRGSKLAMDNTLLYTAMASEVRKYREERKENKNRKRKLARYTRPHPRVHSSQRRNTSQSHRIQGNSVSRQLSSSSQPCGRGVSRRLRATTELIAGWTRAWRTSSVPTKSVEPQITSFMMSRGAYIFRHLCTNPKINK